MKSDREIRLENRGKNIMEERNGDYSYSAKVKYEPVDEGLKLRVSESYNLTFASSEILFDLTPKDAKELISILDDFLRLKSTRKKELERKIKNKKSELDSLERSLKNL